MEEGRDTDSGVEDRRVDQSSERQRVFSSAQVIVSIGESKFCLTVIDYC